MDRQIDRRWIDRKLNRRKKRQPFSFGVSFDSGVFDEGVGTNNLNKKKVVRSSAL